MKTKKCEFCGEYISKDDTFCKSCGNVIKKKESIKDAIIDDPTNQNNSINVDKNMVLYITIGVVLFILAIALFL